MRRFLEPDAPPPTGTGISFLSEGALVGLDYSFVFVGLGIFMVYGGMFSV